MNLKFAQLFLHKIVLELLNQDLKMKNSKINKFREKSHYAPQYKKCIDLNKKIDNRRNFTEK